MRELFAPSTGKTIMAPAPSTSSNPIIIDLEAPCCTVSEDIPASSTASSAPDLASSLFDLVIYDSDETVDTEAEPDITDNSGDNLTAHPIPMPSCAVNGVAAASVDVIVPDKAAPGLASLRQREQPAGARLPQVPPLKRRKLDIPSRKQRQLDQSKRLKSIEDAWNAIKKVLSSKKTNFDAGQQGLQSRRTRAIECHLRLIVKGKHKSIPASKIAAEAFCFATHHGARQLRTWSARWVEERVLPSSRRGQHAKVYSLFNDPLISAELRTYLRSNKWSMDPAKLALFSEKKLIPSAADAYLRHIVREEMPKGLKQYMELVLFPRIQLKVRRGVSLSTARRWMRREGF